LRNDFPFNQGTLTEMAAAESQLLLPVQERIAALIEQGDLEAVYNISQEYVKTVGDMLNDYPLALAQWEETNPELLQKLLIRTWNRLDQDMQKRFLHIMLNLINRVSHSELLKEGVTTGEVKSEPFDFEGDEIDLDRTIEEIIQNPVPSYENIYVIERKKRHKSVVIIMDASGSVQGEKLAMAAVAVASIATNLEGRDEYGVVLFSERVNILKRIDQQKPLDEIIRQVLEIVPEGRTDIGAGLLAGLNEINRATSEQKMAILLTDGQQNMGHDPLALARRFPQLHVINLPGGKEDFSQKIAKCAKGEFIKVNSMLDVPKAILKCLS